MIASVRGRCLSVGADAAVVEVGGIGLELACTSAAVAGLRPGAECTLATILIVREDALTLYGFADQAERALFDQLLGVSGVGPRLALAAVGGLGAASLARAIANGDIGALTTIPGIGKRGAERIVLELKDKVGAAGPVDSALAAPSGAVGWQRQVLDGLVGLGWQPRDAEEAVRLVAADVVAESLPVDDVGQLLRRALNRLDRV